MHSVFIIGWLQTQVAQAICRTLLHSLWQGILIAIVAGIILFVTKKSTALLRYNLLTGLLVVFIITTTTTFIQEYKTTSTNGASDSFIQVNYLHNKTEAAISDKNTTVTNYIQKLFTYFDEHAQIAVTIWMLFVLMHFIKILSGLHYIHRIRHSKVYAVPQPWIKRLESLKDALGIHQKISLLQSGIVKVPAVIGLTKPLILVPLSLLSNLPPAYVEAILLHELAHIRRKDFGVNLLQSAMEMIFFFNPALVWISARMREEREACCDDIVLAQGGDKKSYLQALVYFQDQTTPAASYAMGLNENKHYLLTRVKRMLTHENKKLTIMEKNILAIGLIGLSAMSFIPQTKKQTVTVQKVDAVEAPVKAIIVKERPQTVTVEQVKADVVPVKLVTNRKPTVQPVSVFQDTVPAQTNTETRSTSTSITIDDDGKKTSEIITTGNDGKTYRIKKINGVVTEFMVDGKSIAKEDMGNYTQVLENVERQEKESEKQRAIADENRKVADQKRREMDAQRVIADKQRRKTEEQRIAADEKRRDLDEQRIRADEQRRHMSEKRQEAIERRKETMARGREAEEKRRASQKSESEMEVIVQDLINQKIIKSGEQVSFTLTNQELTVNGVRQDAAMHQKLKEKYRLDTNDSFQYQTDGKGTVRTTVVRN